MTGEAFALLAEYGMFPELYFSSRDVDNISEDFLGFLKQQIDSYNFRPSLHAPFMEQDIGSVNDGLQQRTYRRLQNTLDMAARLGSQRIVIHPGYGDMPDDGEFMQWLKRAGGLLRSLCQKACELGLQIAFENIYDSNPERLYLLLDAAESECAGICFDTGHYNLFSPLPMQSWFGRLGKNILVCHIHDNDRSGDQHLAIGDGSLDYNPLIEWYKQLDTDKKPVMTLEALNRADVITSVTRIKEWNL
ncbi:MAG: hypothetical protein GQF41_1599 [Candidatus Rifleibacterium amylolyticum]|nr:MAG: hypothetical protein GQF41_1599 [Candidatus Rifleibacterium amylolyticum]